VGECQSRTNAPQQRAALFDHLVGAHEQRTQRLLAAGLKRVDNDFQDHRLRRSSYPDFPLRTLNLLYLLSATNAAQ
jgi:hypothetical protein